jgi:hypothetical protein
MSCSENLFSGKSLFFSRYLENRDDQRGSDYSRFEPNFCTVSAIGASHTILVPSQSQGIQSEKSDTLKDSSTFNNGIDATSSSSLFKPVGARDFVKLTGRWGRLAVEIQNSPRAIQV